MNKPREVTAHELRRTCRVTLARLAALTLTLGLDTFVVSAALAPRRVQDRWRVALVVALFEAGMPIIGIAVGSRAAPLLDGATRWVAGLLLIALGVYTLFIESGTTRSEERPRAWGLILTGLSVSLDEATVGFSLGALGLPWAPAIAVILLQAMVLSLAGSWLGQRLASSTEIGEWAASGLLIALGILVAVGYV